MFSHTKLCRIAAITLLWLGTAHVAQAQTLRVVTYNIDADTGGAVGQMGGPDSGPGLATVLQAIGNEHFNGHAQPIDVLALQELNGTPTTTLNYIVGQLNTIYGAGTYAYDTATDPTDGNNLTGNGPSGLIYNTTTVRDLGAVAIGTPSGSGAPRDPMRYQLEPVGTGSAADFYLYVSHAKSGTTSSDANRRNIEATEVRNNAATLGPNAHVIYSGDWNIDSSSEAAYKTLIAAGVGQANDPANPAENWTSSSSFLGILSESATSLKYRDDLQLVTGPVLTQFGMQLAPGSYTAFGNNGSTVYGGSVAAPSNTALGDLANRTTVLTALTTATDHLPVVADYTFVALPGDVNDDGIINGQDVSLVASNWGATGIHLPGDANGDGIINGQDVSLIASNWGNTASGGGGAAVPEPGGLSLVAMGLSLVALLARGRLAGH